MPKAARKRIAESDEPKATATAELKKVEAAKPVAAPVAEPEVVAEIFLEGFEDPEAVKRIEDMDRVEFCKHVGSVCREMDKLMAKIRLFKSSKYGPCIMSESTVDQLKSARGSLWVGRPMYDCPYCTRTGAVS